MHCPKPLAAEDSNNKAGGKTLARDWDLNQRPEILYALAPTFLFGSDNNYAIPLARKKRT